MCMCVRERRQRKIHNRERARGVSGCVFFCSCAATAGCARRSCGYLRTCGGCTGLGRAPWEAWLRCSFRRRASCLCPTWWSCRWASARSSHWPRATVCLPPVCCRCVACSAPSTCACRRLATASRATSGPRCSPGCFTTWCEPTNEHPSRSPLSNTPLQPLWKRHRLPALSPPLGRYAFQPNPAGR